MNRQTSFRRRRGKSSPASRSSRPLVSIPKAERSRIPNPLPGPFPEAVLRESRALPARVLPADLAGRLDCRRHPTITIDPDDARDYDDAFCLERVGGSQWRLWVHIADVSHYVRPGTALDGEARRRGNSTYLVDRVIPMLPEALSNGLCSLVPDADRLTKAVEFLIADDGRVLRTQFHSAVIHSQRRHTYGEALRILERAPATALERMLHQAHGLAQTLRKRRFQAGALALDFPEIKLVLDTQGRVERVVPTVNDVSHQLVEEFMLLANEAVASRLMSRRQPALYRVHEQPQPGRLRVYRREVLHHRVACGQLQDRHEVRRLFDRLNPLPVGLPLKLGFLRALPRARYATQPLGHYGLAKARYTHFTSPIRRYADLVVQRALFDLTGPPEVALVRTAEHLSRCERQAADAERDSRRVKLFAFLNAQLVAGRPSTYPALVTDTCPSGFFVDVPGLALRGWVPRPALGDDTYAWQPAQRRWVGGRSRRSLGMGDSVAVRVAKADAPRGPVEFRLAAGEAR